MTDHSSPVTIRVRTKQSFREEGASIFWIFPWSKEIPAMLKWMVLVANCNTLTNMKKNVFPDILSFIDAAGLRIEESLDGFFAKSGACQFASIAYHLYNKSFEHNFRPDLLLREIAVNVIAANPHEYHQYLEPAVVHLRTRSTRKLGAVDYLGVLEKYEKACRRRWLCYATSACRFFSFKFACWNGATVTSSSYNSKFPRTTYPNTFYKVWIRPNGLVI